MPHRASVTNQQRRNFIVKLQATGRLASAQQAAATVGLAGSFRVPGDKSISHRSIMFGALAEGDTEVSGFLEGADALATLAAFEAMGIVIERGRPGQLCVHGNGMHGLSAPRAALNLGNSGTSMRLLAGLLAGQSFDATLIGDVSLSGRPMNRVAMPLREMGANIETAAQGRPPLHIHGGQALHGIDYVMPVASAQVKSCLLLAGLFASGRTRVTEPAPTRDHTERMLQGFGYAVERDGASASVVGGGKLRATPIDIPADISSAAFFMVAASITPGSELVLQHVGINPTRTGVLDILQLMGADIQLGGHRDVGGEPVADITVRSAPLRGIAIPPELVPLAIDEFPVLFIAAACAEGTTVLSGAEELRVKESDRIQAMVDGLQALGVNVQGTADGAVIEGGAIGAGQDVVAINCHHDHRIAMAFAIASARAQCSIEVDDCDNIVTSFPNFAELANNVGMDLKLD
ncbi:MAG: 3-phosphoshikimate 1-carboxyvinyltransferase [Pseudomonadales bacterium]|nr:3-phosphoshikimate 1-carboxyvinyltransferase [Pseudomonadales bacterium]